MNILFGGTNKMVKSLFKQIGGTYHEENRYLIPNLKLPTEEEHL